MVRPLPPDKGSCLLVHERRLKNFYECHFCFLGLTAGDANRFSPWARMLGIWISHTQYVKSISNLPSVDESITFSQLSKVSMGKGFKGEGKLSSPHPKGHIT